MRRRMQSSYREVTVVKNKKTPPKENMQSSLLETAGAENGWHPNALVIFDWKPLKSGTKLEKFGLPSFVILTWALKCNIIRRIFWFLIRQTLFFFQTLVEIVKKSDEIFSNCFFYHEIDFCQDQDPIPSSVGCSYLWCWSCFWNDGCHSSFIDWGNTLKYTRELMKEIILDQRK